MPKMKYLADDLLHGTYQLFPFYVEAIFSKIKNYEYHLQMSDNKLAFHWST